MVPAGLDAGQEDIFREVIPDGSAKALSRYTDMVDALIREQNDRLAGASDDARLRLRERDLPDCLQVSPLLRLTWGSCQHLRSWQVGIQVHGLQYTPQGQVFWNCCSLPWKIRIGRVHPVAIALAQ